MEFFIILTVAITLPGAILSILNIINTINKARRDEYSSKEMSR